MVNKKLKRVNEKSVLFAIFILLAILALGSLFVVKPKLTGLAVSQLEYYTEGECEDPTVGGYWYNDVCYENEPVCSTDFSFTLFSFLFTITLNIN